LSAIYLRATRSRYVPTKAKKGWGCGEARRKKEEKGEQGGEVDESRDRVRDRSRHVLIKESPARKE